MVSQEMAGGAGNTPTHNPLQNSGPDVSPQMTQSMGMESTYVIRHMCIGLAYSIDHHLAIFWAKFYSL